MAFFALCFFLFYSYVKPHELPGLGWVLLLKPVHLTMLIAVFALANRAQGLRMKEWVRTPHDWLVVLYLGWLILFCGSPGKTLGDYQAHIVAYFICQQLLVNIDIMRRLLFVWAGILMFLSLLAVGVLVGFDPLDSLSLVEGRMKGRLVVNLSMVKNPNALGHTLVPLIPMLYFLVYWKRIFLKAGLVLFIPPLWAIYQTQSKGAFLSAAAAFVFSMSFGRPKWVQVLILISAMSFGWSGLMLLPRMHELEKAKMEGGIQGRVEALRFGYKMMEEHTTGIGPGNFGGDFTKVHGFTKTSHNAYCMTGAEAGRTGLWLLVAMLWCCGRSLVAARTANVEEERVRRTLFVLLSAFCVSCWMVEFTYRVWFFMLIAFIGAFHRHISGLNRVLVAEREADRVNQRKARWEKPVEAELAGAGDGGAAGLGRPAASVLAPRWGGTKRAGGVAVAPAEGPAEVVEGAHSVWKRWGWMDVVMTFVLLYGVERLWLHLIDRMGAS